MSFRLTTDEKVDGLRVDTVKHVQKDFWPGYNKAAGVYCVGEVFDGDADYTCPYQQVMDGLLNYPMWVFILFYLLLPQLIQQLGTIHYSGPSSLPVGA